MASNPLLESLRNPRSVEQDGTAVTSHSLSEQIEATKFLMATRARSRGGMCGVLITKMCPHGAVLASDIGGNRAPVTGL